MLQMARENPRWGYMRIKASWESWGSACPRLRIYVQRYNRRRPHRGLELQVPEGLAPVEEADGVPDIERRDLLGGLVHEYMRAA